MRKTNLINRWGVKFVRNETQVAILSEIAENGALRVRQIARRLKRKYSTIYEEIQNMKEAQQLIKTPDKSYRINPKYCECLIHTGFEMLGVHCCDYKKLREEILSMYALYLKKLNKRVTMINRVMDRYAS